MKLQQALAILVVVGAFSVHAVTQTDKAAAPPSATPKKHTPTKILLVSELHEVARSITVEISERTQGGSGFRHLGSGVWLAEGIVATCWHVVNAATGPIKVSLGTGGVTTYGDSVLYGGFEDYASTVVASDQASDVAILKTDENPFRSPKVLRGTPTQKIMPKLGVARVNGDIPAAGTLTVLSGYPLNISVLVSQTGNVAGTGATPGPPIGEPLKAVRILVSVVSNGGNSGGPVLNDHGELIGLLEGNFLAPVVDPQTRSQLYGFVPKTDSSGNPIKDDKGNIQVTIVAPLTQNSGISMVIPARLIIPLLKQAAERK